MFQSLPKVSVCCSLVRVSAVGMLVALAGFAGVVRGQDKAAEPAGDAAPKSTMESMIEDFTHYVMISQLELADALAGDILNSGVPATEFSKLVDAGDARRFESAVSRAMRANPQEAIIDIAAFRDRAGKLQKFYETGKLDQARLPEQIAANIAALKGNQRARMMARAGLVRASEYAMPQLLEAFLQQDDAELSTQAQSVMVDLGRSAMVPLTTALPHMPEVQQERIVRVLGLIPYKSSLPALADLTATTQSGLVREAATASINRLGGATADAGTLYRGLAEDYYNEKSDVTNFPGEDYQLLWGYKPGAGLTMQAIKTPVFHEAMAMSLLERGMSLEGKSSTVNPESLALWVASNYSREFDTPKGYTNPAYPIEGAMGESESARRGAEYFGVASGPDVAQRVLGRALKDKDTPLARRALAAVEKTAGGKLALGDGVNRSPLSAALTYPSRRVQTDAALAISAAQPSTNFVGSERVVPVLASAVRGTTEQFAAVLSSDTERYQSARAILEKNGFKVMPQGRNLGDLEAALSDVPVVDLVVATGVNAESLSTMIEEVRSNTRTAAAPLMVITSQETYTEQARRYAADRTIALRPSGIGESAIVNTVNDLIEQTTGGKIDEAEASAYADRALGALRDLALAGNQVLRVSDASSPLIEALGKATGQRASGIAEVLSRVPTDKAQKALMDSALAMEGTDRAALLSSVAASARRFGNQLEERHVAQLLEIAKTAPEAEATAASSLMGALNLPNNELLQLILGSVGGDGASRPAGSAGESAMKQ